MNCQYCQVETQQVEDQSRTFRCPICKSTYLITLTGKMHLIEWKPFDFNQQSYLVTIRPYVEPNTGIKAPSFTVYYYYMDPPSAPKPQVAGWKEILRLGFIPNWTPQNITQKLKMYLPFL